MGDLAFYFQSPEGLVVNDEAQDDGTVLIQEVGHFGYVIHQYRIRPDLPITGDFTCSVEEDSLQFLAERLRDLEARCTELARVKPTPIELPRWRWNRKVARRRMRRWLDEHDTHVIKLPQELHEIVEGVLEHGVAPHLEDDAAIDKDFDRVMSRALDRMHDYERRRRERVPPVVSDLPGELEALLKEANEAYFNGLFRAASALCRAIMEDVLRQVVTSSVGWPIPIEEDNLVALISCVPSHVWGKNAKQAANEIRETGNEAMHNAKAQLDERQTWRNLVLTGKLLELLVNQRGLRSRTS